jgi:hypothetical protein
VSEAHLSIQAATERVRVLRTRLHVVAPRLDELELGVASAEADRARVAQLESDLAEREEMRNSVRERLTELGRMLGQ